MRVAVVGLGTAGAATACLLADRGHEVVVLERAADPRAVGAGLWLQDLGQRVLDRLGVLDTLRERSQPVSRVDIRTAGGRRLLDLSYDDVPGAVPALGVHRGTLFALLLEQVRRRPVAVETGRTVAGVRPERGRLVVDTDDGPRGGFDLVVGADGSRSPVRAAMGVTRRDRPYGYGALWSIVDDPDGLAGDRLFQSLAGTRRYLGVLPTGLGRASVFWSVHHRDVAGLHAAGLDAWRAEAAPLAGPMAPLLERVDHLLTATYRDVVVSSTHRLVEPRRGSAAAVLLGDAAHAMSPQLGVGTSLALADALVLDRALAAHADLGDALAAHAAARAAHVRWYQWWTRLMMPVFQSGATPLAWPRDALAPWVPRLPGMTPVLVRTLCGDRTSPWARVRLG